MSGKKRSDVWLHFTRKEDKALCSYCKIEISMRRGNTSNLIRHLSKRHPSVAGRNDGSVVLIQNQTDQPQDVEFELEDEPHSKGGPEVAAAYRVRWTSKSEARERRRLRNAESRLKRISYLEPMEDDSEEAEKDEMMPEVSRPVKRDVFPRTSTTMVTPATDDSDRYFLLSLLPLMKKLRPEDNMDIRIQIQNAFRDKLFPLKNPLEGIIEEVVARGDQKMH